MTERFTKAAARNIFFGGSLFFFVVFIALVAISHTYILNKGTNTATLSDSVARGKHVWEKNACIDCHTILGEGAYFAPELGNVWVRYGGDKDADAARSALKGWMKAQPSRIEGRRQMPQFNLNEGQLDDLVEFLHWTSTINTQNWPPKVSG